MACGWCRFFDPPRVDGKDGVEWVDDFGECRLNPTATNVRRSYICSNFEFDRYQSNSEGGRSMIADWWLMIDEHRETIKKLRAAAKKSKERAKRRAKP